MKKQIFLLSILVSLAFGFKDVESDEVSMMAASQDVVVVDVRTKEEWIESGVIQNSIPITYFDAQAKPLKDDFIKKLQGYTKGDKTKPVLLVCRTGFRSKLVSGILEREGYKNVYNYKYGMVNWLSERRATVKPKI